MKNGWRLVEILKLNDKVKIHTEKKANMLPHSGAAATQTVELHSPYDGKVGTVVGTRENIDKHGDKTMLYMVRLKMPPLLGNVYAIGFPEEALEVI